MTQWTKTYINNTGDFGWANQHAGELAAQYPGKLLGVYQKQVVIVADDKADYHEKVRQWFVTNPPTQNSDRMIVPVLSR